MKTYLKDNKKGFTLVELIVVLVVVVILAAVLILSLIGYIDKAKAATQVSKARNLSTAVFSASTEWYAKGQPGNGDSSYKINIEQLIIDYIGDDSGSDKMVSYEKNRGATENVVQVGFSQVGSQWNRFLKECKSKGYKNFLLVFMHKDPSNIYKIDEVIDGIYYLSADGRYAVRIVYTEGRTLGDVGVSWEKI